MSDPQADFKNLVRAYVEACDKLDAMARIRKEKTELGKQILEFMKANDVAQCNLRDGGKLVLKSSKSVAPLKKDYIVDQLAVRLGNKDTAQSIVSQLWSNRQVSTKDTLKRVTASNDDEA